MFSLRSHVLISGGLFLLILAMAMVGNAIQAAGVVTHPDRLQTPARIVFFTLFLLFALSLAPTMIKLFVAGQHSIGNRDKPLIVFVDRHQTAMILGLWSIWLLGLAVAMPTMIRGGFFAGLGDATNTSSGSIPPSTATDGEIARQIARMPTQGTVVAAPGMTTVDMIAKSTLRIQGGPGSSRNSVPFSGGAIFDFQVAKTGIVFHRCRYYFITTYSSDPTRIESINVGTASSKMTRAELEATDTKVRAELKKDGWLTGHEVYKTEEDQTLHIDGTLQRRASSTGTATHPTNATRGEEGKLWLKDNIVLNLERRRLDDPVPSEDPNAGQWIQYIDLRARDRYPGIERYVFEPAAK